MSIGIEKAWNRFLISPLEMRDFIDSSAPLAAGDHCDVGNVLLTENPEHWIRILGQRIVRVHIKGFQKSIHAVKGFVDLLEGTVDLEAMKATLAEIDYDYSRIRQLRKSRWIRQPA